MEYTEETALQFVKDVLIKNGFRETTKQHFIKKENIMITIEHDHYVVSHYDEAFLEWMDWFSHDLTIYPLLGYLSYYEFIERGYKI